ncbi:RcnB family protein [Pseudomarimonas salicorniae]|uniref:RcnB family protein n=1 Tax=Pseudomarimonas salicorniae TaxID=2933270 RepID=A0ABT0GL08_9GAMM|nr:RcnB family protein [Lysobacter sp. CAU 1642]MCK7595226.1 RcnB family protein [Lysobacter sp. CAU 1642]
MFRFASSTLMIVGLLAAGSVLAQDYQRGRSVDRGEARVSGQRHDGARAHPQRGQEYGQNRGETHWERDTRLSRDSRFHVQEPEKHDRGYDPRRNNHGRRGHDHDRWQVDRGLPHSDPRYRDYRDDRYRDHRSDWRDPKWRVTWHHGWSGHRYRAPIRYYYPQGYSTYHWRVGYTLPSAFLLSSWQVDYRPYGIAPPPYGCRWVRVDGDLLLVELATGYIVDVLYDFYY